MSYTQAGYIATNKYKAKNYKRIPFDVRIEMYDEIKAAADHAGESVNGYIKQSVLERMEREKNQVKK